MRYKLNRDFYIKPKIRHSRLCGNDGSNGKSGINPASLENRDI